MLVNVTIEERVSSEFKVEAGSIEEAMTIAQKKYNDGEYVLEPGSVTAKSMLASCGSACTDWIDF